MRILLAEDDAAILRALTELLKRGRYDVDAVDNGRDALDYLLAGGYDAAVLDIMMPKMSGLEALREARAAGIATPVLLLTAKGEVEDRVAGLDAGADDYLPKPFAPGELMARVRALTRRSAAYAQDTVTFGGVTLDCAGYTLGGVRLNNKEFRLLELFFRNPGRIFSAETLMERVWGLDSDAEIDVVWTYVAIIRKRLREAGGTAEIRTVRGAGYVLEDGNGK